MSTRWRSTFYERFTEPPIQSYVIGNSRPKGGSRDTREEQTLKPRRSTRAIRSFPRRRPASGQELWAIRRRLGGWSACGQGLHVAEGRVKLAVGLLDWCEPVAPTAEAIAGVPVLDRNAAHVQTFELPALNSWSWPACKGLPGVEVRGVGLPEIENSAHVRLGCHFPEHPNPATERPARRRAASNAFLVSGFGPSAVGALGPPPHRLPNGLPNTPGRSGGSGRSRGASRHPARRHAAAGHTTAALSYVGAHSLRKAGPTVRIACAT